MQDWRTMSSLVRVLAECTVNAVYISFSEDDQIANDYADFPAVFERVEY